MTRHHVDDNKVDLMVLAGTFNPGNIQYRFGLVDANLIPVEIKIREIRAAAQKGDCAEVLRLLDAEIEFGHG